MSLVTASIDIPAAPSEVWKLVMDPHHLGDWVTIHRKLLRADDGPVEVGYEMDQRISLRGVSLEVRWKLIECKPCHKAVWEGHGPARSRALTQYTLHALSEHATRFDYRNEFHAPLGLIGALASRALVRATPEQEAKQTLKRLCAHLKEKT
jgi:carbon monoxide dehydrogenase subunit G